MIVQGTGVTAGLQLVDYYLGMQNPPKITLLWCVRERHVCFEEAVNLNDRKDSSTNFRYVIISDIGGTLSRLTDDTAHAEATSDEDEHEARLDFLQLCDSNGMVHHETADALLTWISCSRDKDDKRTFVSGPEPPESNDREPEPGKDISLSNLARIGESLKTGLELKDQMHDHQDTQCFRGYDAVSFLVEEGYTPSRESALGLGRELASKLDLFSHATNARRLLLDDAEEKYIFSGIITYRPSDRVLREPGTRNFDLSQGLLVTICGGATFEQNMKDVLKEVGVIEDQVINFPEGSSPLSELSEFIPRRENLAKSKVRFYVKSESLDLLYSRPNPTVQH